MCSIVIEFILEISRREVCIFVYQEFKAFTQEARIKHMKTLDISGNCEGRKPGILGWKWCESRLLLLITSYFFRVQPIRGSYLKRGSNSHKFSACYNPQEAPTSTSYKLFFFKLQHRKEYKFLKHNIKSQTLFSSYTILLSSFLLKCFFFSLFFSFVTAHQFSDVDSFH